MDLLLDTHTFLWFIADNSRLSTQARVLIADPQNNILLSLASAWEIVIKSSRGKLVLSQPLPALFGAQLESDRITILPITLEHTLHVANLPHHHGDPFDRMLIAQAQFEQIPIISADSVFDSYGVTRLW